MNNTRKKQTLQSVLMQPASQYYKDVPSIDPHVLQQIWEQWEPERPELLVRLRPYTEGMSHA
jgi:hypothetical protein